MANIGLVWLFLVEDGGFCTQNQICKNMAKNNFVTLKYLQRMILSFSKIPLNF